MAAGIKYRSINNTAKAQAVLRVISNSPQFANYDATVTQAIGVCQDALTVGINGNPHRQAICDFIALLQAANQQGLIIDKYESSSMQIFYHDWQRNANYRVVKGRLPSKRLSASVKEFVPLNMNRHLNDLAGDFTPAAQQQQQQSASSIANIEEANDDSGYESPEKSAPGTPAGSHAEVSNASAQQNIGSEHLPRQVASLSSVGQTANIAWDSSLRLGSRGGGVSRFAQFFEQRYPGYVPAGNIFSCGAGVQEAS